LEDAPWPLLLFLNAAILGPPLLVGLAFSTKLRLAALSLAVLWAIAWLWMVYEKGFAGAFNRTSAFIPMMAFLSLPLIAGWMLGRFMRRRRLAYANAVTHGK
jgi:hypothetical protein